MHYLNQLEPDTLIQHFLAHPPEGFCIEDSVSGLPAFVANFDLLTTADDDFQKKLKRLPLYRYWCALLRIRTCFVGTTVSEYALLPNGIVAEDLAINIKEGLSKKQPLLIVKDIPHASPLLDKDANDYSDTLMTALAAQNFICLSGQALAWVPVDYASIEDYLSRLSSGRRKDMRRKLKKNTDVDVQILSSGADCFNDPQLLDQFYQLYLNVYEQSEIHFDLLSRDFFTAVLQDKTSNGIIFTYQYKDKLIGYNICYIVNDVLMDKYVGFEYPAARAHSLYFISWFYNLDYALQHGLKHYVAGWTDPEIKAYLGASFTFTRHAVYVRNPVLRTILRRLSKHFESDQAVMAKMAPEAKQSHE